MARQFNLIPPVCEQAEYHFFQRDKVEVQLPELYHKIGIKLETLNVLYTLYRVMYDNDSSKPWSNSLQNRK